MQEALHAVHKHDNREGDSPENWPHNESWDDSGDDCFEVASSFGPST